MPHRYQHRRSFTLLETIAAMALVTAAMMLAVRIGYWSLRARVRAASEQAAQELACNALERAAAQPWEQLTAQWAAQQTLPPPFDESLPGAKLTLQVEPLPKLRLTKRVTAEVRWQLPGEQGARSVRLVTLLSARTTRVQGEQQ